MKARNREIPIPRINDLGQHFGDGLFTAALVLRIRLALNTVDPRLQFSCLGLIG